MNAQTHRNRVGERLEETGRGVKKKQKQFGLNNFLFFKLNYCGSQNHKVVPGMLHQSQIE